MERKEIVVKKEDVEDKKKGDIEYNWGVRGALAQGKIFQFLHPAEA